MVTVNWLVAITPLTVTPTAVPAVSLVSAVTLVPAAFILGQSVSPFPSLALNAQAISPIWFALISSPSHCAAC